MKRQKVALIVILVFVALLLILILWRPFLDETLRKLVINEISRRLDAEVTVAELKTELFPPKVKLEGVEIKKESGPLHHVGARRITLIPGPGPVLTGRITMKKVVIEEPSLELDLSARIPTAKKRRFKWMKIPSLRDLVRVDLDEVEVDRAKLSILLPWKGVRFSVKSGTASFQGRGDSERWTWQGKGELERGDRVLELDQVQIEALRDGSDVQIEQFTIGIGQTVLNVKGKAYPEADLQYFLDSEIQPLIQEIQGLNLLKRDVDVRGLVRAKGQVQGSWGELHTDHEWLAQQLVFRKRQFPDTKIIVRTQKELIEAVRIEATPGSGTFQASLGNFREGRPTAFEIHGRDLSLVEILRIAVPKHDPKVDTQFSLDVQGQFQLKPLALNGTYTVSTPELNFLFSPSVKPYLPLQFRNISTHGKVNWIPDHGLVLEEGEANAAGVQAKYRFDFAKTGVSKGTWSGSLQDLSKAFPDDFPAYGKGGVTGDLVARSSSYQVQLRLKLDQLGYGDYGPLPMQGVIALRDQGASFENFILANKNNRLTLSAEVPYETNGRFALKADLKSFPLGWVAEIAGRGVPGIGVVDGEGDAKLNLHGSLEELAGTMSVAGSDLNVHGWTIDRLSASISVDKGKYTFHQADIVRDEAKISVTGAISKTQYEDFQVRVTKVPVQFFGLPDWVSTLTSHLTGQLELKGDFKNPRTTGNLDLLTLEKAKTYNRQGTLAISEDMTRAKWALEYGNGSFSASGSTNLRNLTDFRGEGNLKSFVIPQLPGKAKATISGNWSLRGNLKDLNSFAGSLALNEASLIQGDRSLKLKDPAIVVIERGKLKDFKAELIGDPTQLHVQGTASLRGDLSLKVRGLLSLRILPVIIHGVARSEGEAVTDAEIHGTFREPRLTGSISVQKGFLQIRNFPHNIENLSMKLFLDQRRIFVEGLQAAVAGGRLTSKGQVLLGSAKEETTITLDGNVEQLQLRFPSWLPSNCSGKIGLSGPLSHPLLRGDLTVHEATYKDTWDWKSKILTFGRQRLDRMTSGKEDNVRFDLMFRSEGAHFYLKNNLATATMSAQVRLTGSDQKIGLVGRVNVIKGEVAFLDNEFEITSGIVTFESEREVRSNFDINAKTRVEQTDILLEIQTQEGEVQAFVTSRPPKDETSIIALLTLGADVDALGSSGTGNSNLSAAVLPGVLSGPLQSKVEGGLKRANVVDSLQLVPFFSSETKTSGLRMIAGKQLFPKVKLLYSTDLFNLYSENTVKLEHNLSENFSIQESVKDNYQGSANNDLDVGLDFEFRFEF